MPTKVQPLATAILAALVLGSCGGGAAPTQTVADLSGAERLLIAQQVVLAALGGIVDGGVAARDTGGAAPLSGLKCDKTCADGRCTITCVIDERLDCPAGGTATDKGSIRGTLDAESTGEAALEATQTFSDCEPKAGLTIAGDPSTTASGSARFERGELAPEQTVRVAGAVRYSGPSGSGRCPVDVRVTFSRSRHGSARGTACGDAIDATF